MKVPEISVLVPIYNAELFLSRCINSILLQSFNDFELLLIDDGSTDSSGEICDKYAQNDPRIRVFHKENSGISSTREFGVNRSQGNYILFVDSDDYIELDMLKIMYNNAIEFSSDVVGCSFFEEFEKHSLKIKTYYADRKSFLKDVIRSNWGVMWKILVKRSLYIDNDIHFPDNINGGEDYYVCANLLLAAKIVTCVDEYLYHYVRYNNTSFMSTKSLTKIQYQIDATKLVEDTLYKKGMISIYEKELNIRKFISKLPLFSEDFKKACETFPEANLVGLSLNLGFRNKIKSLMMCFGYKTHIYRLKV